MSTHVYANGLEISSQAADGIASVAFPDPCWSPPAPPAGPIVIPYPNTARPKSLKNGSCTVFICGKPVALEDHSYFSTSTGNEAATQAFGKGVATGVIKGKAYHRSWSMDVMIEGRGVARHTDLMTHNHGGAIPGNTPMFPYLSRPAPPEPPCKQDEQRITDTCGSDDKLTNEHEHCKGLQSTSEKYADDLQKIFEDNSDDPKVLEKIDSALAEMQANASQNMAPYAKEIRNLINKNKDKFELFNNLSDTEKETLIHDLIPEQKGEKAALNGALATLNKCLTARKCRLVPYAEKGDAKTEPANNGGCCPGQTGHHLITDKMVKGGNCSVYHEKTNPKGLYRTETALTVCVEGNNQHHGTHGLVHAKLGDAIQDLESRGRVQNEMMDLNAAIDAAAESHHQAFPRSGCSKKCIKAQLNDYYGKACHGAQFVAVGKDGKPRKPASGGKTFDR